MNSLPVSSQSGAYVSTIGASTSFHPDFSSSGGGIPFNIVPASQPQVSVTFDSPDESDPGPYPIPSNATIESGSDHHVLVIDQGNCKLYELFSAYKGSGTSWGASSGAVFDLRSNILRPDGWTSADAAGLPIFPGLIRYDELMSGAINHALRFTAPRTADTYVWPARHQASSLSGSQYPPLGTRFRLKASVNVSSYPFEVQVILNALKKYGAFLADNGSSWYFQGAPDSRWNDSNLHALSQIVGSDMEVVDESGLKVSPNSGVVAGGSTVADGVYLDQRQVSAGGSLTAQAILTGKAPSGGASVAITTSNSGVLSVPSTVTVPSGAASATIPVTIQSISSTTPGVLSAQYGSGSGNSPVLLVTGSSRTAAPRLSALSTSAGSVSGGGSITGTVSLTSAAPSGGTVVTLSSSSTSVASVPASVTVGSGATTANFTISSHAQSTNTTDTIGAMLNGEALSVPITVTSSGSGPVALNSVTLSPTTVTGGANVAGTVTLTGPAPSGGVTVSLSSSIAAIASVPASVAVPANSSSANFTVTTYKVGSDATATITAKLNSVTDTANLTVDVQAAATSSIWGVTATPGTVTDSDPNAVELGVKFRSDVAGNVTGVRFYKGPENSGTHVGNLWSSNGTLLSTVTFTNETSSGWQQANFKTPVAIQPNTTYIVSYHASKGHYSADNNFFTSAANSAPLHALQNGTDGPNGVYLYGSGGFPNQSWEASNYWVDLVFSAIN